MRKKTLKEYIVVDSKGRDTTLYIQAYDLKEAQQKHRDIKAYPFGKVKRVCVNDNNFKNIK